MVRKKVGEEDIHVLEGGNKRKIEEFQVRWNKQP